MEEKLTKKEIIVQMVISYLRDKEFSEEELINLLRQSLEEYGIHTANISLAQFTEKVRTFKDKRDQRLREECINFVVHELNEERREIKLARAQDQYKINRRAKKRGYKNFKKPQQKV
jgi:hypothetical protein